MDLIVIRLDWSHQIESNVGFVKKDSFMGGKFSSFSDLIVFDDTFRTNL